MATPLTPRTNESSATLYLDPDTQFTQPKTISKKARVVAGGLSNLSSVISDKLDQKDPQQGKSFWLTFTNESGGESSRRLTPFTVDGSLTSPSAPPDPDKNVLAPSSINTQGEKPTGELSGDRESMFRPTVRPNQVRLARWTHAGKAENMIYLDLAKSCLEDHKKYHADNKTGFFSSRGSKGLRGAFVS